MARTVYCFNTYNEPINQLNVNGLSAGTVAGWIATGTTIYTPASVAVPRVRHGDGTTVAAFPNDVTAPIRIDWDSFTIQTSINIGQFSDVSLDDDLILYFAVNQMTLMTARGFVLTSIPYQPASKSAAAAEEVIGSIVRTASSNLTNIR